MKIKNIPGLAPHQVMILEKNFGPKIFGRKRVALIAYMCECYNRGDAVIELLPITRMYKKKAKKGSFVYENFSGLIIKFATAFGFLFKIEFDNKRKDRTVITIAF